LQPQMPHGLHPSVHCSIRHLFALLELKGLAVSSVQQVDDKRDQARPRGAPGPIETNNDSEQQRDDYVVIAQSSH
jgi:hypothetical protein